MFDRFREIQKAQQAGEGIWSIENYAKEDGYHPEVVKKAEEPAERALIDGMIYKVKYPEIKQDKCEVQESCNEKKCQLEH